MSTLPDGVDESDLHDHAVTLQLTAQLINATSAFLDAEGGSEAEGDAEEALDALAHVIANSPKAAGSVVLALASIIVGTSDNDTVQAWFADQASHIAAALAHE